MHFYQAYNLTANEDIQPQNGGDTWNLLAHPSPVPEGSRYGREWEWGGEPEHTQICGGDPHDGG
ncbi:MAG: hypothetical protein ABFC94_18895 [Syntrophomonas sp.]